MLTQFYNMLKEVIYEFKFSSDRTINSVKTAIACFIGLCLVEFPGSPLNQWTLISIVVVMAAQINLGSITKKSYDRIAGTLIGALVAGISVMLFYNQLLILDAILILVCLVFAYIAAGTGTNNQVGTLGASTAIMILLARPLNTKIIFLRPLEIIVGICIALLVTHFIFPIRATVRLKMSLGAGLEQLKALFLLESDIQDAESFESIKKIEESLLNLFVAQRTLVKDSKAETLNALKKSTLYDLMNHERRLHRAILLAAYSLHNSTAAALIIHDLSDYQKAKQEISERLSLLAEILNAKATTVVPKITPLDLQALFAALRTLSAAQELFELRLYIDAFTVSLQFFAEELAAMSKKVQEMYV